MFLCLIGRKCLAVRQNLNPCGSAAMIEELSTRYILRRLEDLVLKHRIVQSIVRMANQILYDKLVLVSKCELYLYGRTCLSPR